ncbi:hypothetical protein SO802_013956 [Lithocarpus litseifolius]|uniref:Uncharacterized protein n=1 Tax=Lithocarpus litseifolius TaxID=425828 RepID=A0AAW2DAS1_9ROSI
MVVGVGSGGGFGREEWGWFVLDCWGLIVRWVLWVFNLKSDEISKSTGIQHGTNIGVEVIGKASERRSRLDQQVSLISESAEPIRTMRSDEARRWLNEAEAEGEAGVGMVCELRTEFHVSSMRKL